VSGARRTAQAVEAAVAVAATHGLRCDEPIVLAHHSNALVHLRPAPIVARVATVTAPFRPGSDWLRREVAVAGYLAAGGAPVLPPSDLLPPGPHEHEGLHLTFWQYVDVRGEVDPAAAGASLHEIHRLLHGFTDELPSFDPLPETERLLDTVPLQPGDRAPARRPPPHSPTCPMMGMRCTATRTSRTSSPRPVGSSGSTSRTPAPARSSGTSPASRPRRDSGGTPHGRRRHSQRTATTIRRSSRRVPVRALFSTAWGLYALAQGARDPSRTAHRLAWWRQRYS
jgi:hypothetical protein